MADVVRFSGPTHCTTNSQAGNPTADLSHLTLSVSPGKKSAHLYLDPDDGTTATEDTTIAKIIWG